MKQYKVGILGAGHIAEKMATTLQQMSRAKCYAVASRSYEKARDFASRHGAEKAYGTYSELVADPDVDLIYVATPHSLHFVHARQCMMGGKAVICEKSFTCNADEATKLFEMSEERGVFITEAIWTRYMPLMQKIKQLVYNGVIGKPHTLSANLGYAISHKERIQRPELGGGALLDIGVYTLNFAAMVFGTDIDRIDTSCTKTDTGVDAQESTTLWYRDGRMAQLYSSIYAKTDRQGIISGEDGHIIVDNINNPSTVRVFDKNYTEVIRNYAPKQITGFEYEIEACADALDRGLTETPIMPHAETLRMMTLMDGLRKRWGVAFPNDRNATPQ